MTQEVDDFLAHFGVKGMHWGVRNAESKAREASDKKASRKQTTWVNDTVKARVANEKPKSREQIQARLNKISRQHQKLNSELHAEGVFNLSRGGIHKQRKDGTLKTYWAPRTEEGAARIAKTRIGLEGAFAATAIMTVGILAVNHLKLKPQTARGTKFALGLMATKLAVLPSVRAIRSVNEYEKGQRIRSEKYQRQRQLAALDGKKLPRDSVDAYIPNNLRLKG